MLVALNGYSGPGPHENSLPPAYLSGSNAPEPSPDNEVIFTTIYNIVPPAAGPNLTATHGLPTDVVGLAAQVVGYLYTGLTAC